MTLMNDAMLLLRDQFVGGKFTQVVSVSEHPREDADFRSTITQLKAHNPDAIYLLLWSPQLSIFAKQLRESQLAIPMFGTQNMEDRDEVAAAKGALDGTWFVGLDDTAAEQYFAKYRARFGSEPTAGGPNAYDATLMIIDGLPTGHVNDFIHQLRNFEGSLGTYSAQRTNDFELRPRLRCVAEGMLVDDCEPKEAGANERGSWR
ncbi:MAG: ABC transporter substrate-binding protein [Deltaproteobacteria bacterium]|nr:ABC transporter substrate-binding protein [Deltaproteobacteria bacterium]